MTVVLDTSAYLAFVLREPGGERVATCLSDAVMSSVNMGETIAKLVDRGFAQPDVGAKFAAAGIGVLPFDEPQGLLSGQLRAATRTRGLSLGDRACLALALTLNAPVLTADRAWAGLDVGVPVEVIR